MRYFQYLKVLSLVLLLGSCVAPQQKEVPEAIPHVISSGIDKEACRCSIEFSKDRYTLSCKGNRHTFSNVKELKALLAKYKPLIGDEKVLMAPESETKIDKIKEVFFIIKENGLEARLATREKLQ